MAIAKPGAKLVEAAVQLRDIRDAVRAVQAGSRIDPTTRTAGKPEGNSLLPGDELLDDLQRP